MSGALSLGAAILLSYLAGSFPTSVVVGRLFFGKDLRAEGSGNAGGTNAFRVLGWKAGVAVVLVDVGKGLLAALVLAPIGAPSGLRPEALGLLAGAAAVAGHVWTVFAGFRGGKGIATAGGMLIGVAPIEVAVSFGVFGLVFLLTHYVSLGSLSAAVAFPVTMFFRENVFMAQVEGYGTLIFFSMGISLLIIYTHRKNITRLLRGTESRITGLRLFKKKETASAAG